MENTSKIEKIATDFSEVLGLSFLLGITVIVCGCARIRDIVERTFDPKGYAKREGEKEEVVERYISALRRACSEPSEERKEREF